jgi:hypothetical protein
MPSKKKQRKTSQVPLESRVRLRGRRPKNELTLSSSPRTDAAESDPGVSVTRAAQHYPSASAFVRTQPVDVPAKQVVAAGARLGLKLTSNLVRIVRYKMRRAGLAKPALATKRPLRKTRPPAIVPATGTNELQFKKLVIELGIARARTLVDAVAQSLESLISGE